MSAVEEAEKMILLLTPSEKAQLLQRFARDIDKGFPGIETTPDVSGGEPCIVHTRIPVWVLERARQLGTSEAEILVAYPTLRAVDLANAWNYVRAHREQIEREIRDNEVDSDPTPTGE